MLAEFKNVSKDTIKFDDNGITYHDGGKVYTDNNFVNVYCPYGSITKFKSGLLGLTIRFNIDDRWSQVVFVPDGKDKAEFKKAVDFASNAISKAPAAKAVNLDAQNEHYIYCEVCGKVTCYTDEDLRMNEVYKYQNKLNATGAVAGALGGSGVLARMDSAKAEAAKSKIIDTNKCSYCNSTNVREVTLDEYNSMKENNSTQASNVSPIEEVKKLKELLDMGIITQEEFDTKKKQLLGL